MKALRVNTPGGPEVLSYEDVAEPQPKAGEATVKIDAAGINYIDVYQRSGQYKLNLPLTLGLEAGGTVTAVGPNVTEVKVGDKVAYTGVAGALRSGARRPGGPGVLPPVIGLVPRGRPSAMVAGAALRFLGLGIRPATPDWGEMLGRGRAFMGTAWWLSTFPGLAIAIVVLAINRFGDGLRDALDPRMKL